MHITVQNRLPEIICIYIHTHIYICYILQQYNCHEKKKNEIQKLLNEKKNLENCQHNLSGDSDTNLDQQNLEKLKKIF